MQSYNFDYFFRRDKVSVNVDYERGGYKNAGLRLKTKFAFGDRKAGLDSFVLNWVPEELGKERILKEIRKAVERNINLYLIYSLSYENKKRMDRVMRHEYRRHGR